mgnify:CR=1 FL=1
MRYYNTKKETMEVKVGHSSFSLLGEEQGCMNGCCAGISYYSETEYTPIAVHEDQEGFVVLSGTTRAMRDLLWKEKVHHIVEISEEIVLAKEKSFNELYMENMVFEIQK